MSFQLYDLEGHVLKELPAEFYPAGQHTIPIHNDQLNSGVYLLKINSGFNSRSIKIIKH